MSSEYYIVSEQDASGPYDIVALVVKIRNRTLLKEHYISRNDVEETRPAGEWQELKGFFLELEARKEEAVAGQAVLKKRNLFSCLKYGSFFLQQNMTATVFSGIFVLWVIAITTGINFLVPPGFRAFLYIAGFIFIYFLFSCYMLMILRLQRGQPLHTEYFVDKIKQSYQKVIRISLVISFPIIIGIIFLTAFEDSIYFAIAGLFIIVIPGIYIITVYSFAPLLIFDQGYEVWDAMETSRKYILKSGSDNFGIYFSLNAINFIAALLVILPMVITLPITMASVAESYDEIFS